MKIIILIALMGSSIILTFCIENECFSLEMMIYIKKKVKWQENLGICTKEDVCQHLQRWAATQENADWKCWRHSQKFTETSARLNQFKDPNALQENKTAKFWKLMDNSCICTSFACRTKHNSIKGCCMLQCVPPQKQFYQPSA